MRILEVYSVYGKWYYLKYFVVVVLLLLRKFIIQFSKKKDKRPGYGILSHDSPAEMDRKQQLSEDAKAFDAVYINGANRTGWYLIAGLARRPLNVDGFLIVKVPGVGLLLSPKLPSTNLKRNDEEESDSFYSEGLSITPLEPMKAWHIHYRGIMRLYHNPRQKVCVTIDATWKSELSVFNYDTDMLTENIAKALSTEEWTHNLFQCMKEHHQHHYEQFGDLVGNIMIDDTEFNLNMSALRDHSFGTRREWKIFHRYVLHIFTLADGRRGVVGIVCIPSMFSRLEVGYLYGKNRSMNAVSNINLELYQHGEEGIPPTDYGFTFTAGKEIYEVKVYVEDTTDLFLGLEKEAYIIESLCRYTINNVEGWGVVEWMYSNFESNS